MKGKFLVRVMLKDIFGLAEYQEKATYGLDYELTLTRNKDDAVLIKAEAIADARIELDNIHLYYLAIHPPFHNKVYVSKF